MIDSIDPNEKPRKKEITNSSTPVLDNFSRDLIKLAELGKLDPVVGRDSEIKRIAQTLLVGRRIIRLLLENLVVVKLQLLKDWP